MVRGGPGGARMVSSDTWHSSDLSRPVYAPGYQVWQIWPCPQSAGGGVTVVIILSATFPSTCLCQVNGWLLNGQQQVYKGPFWFGRSSFTLFISLRLFSDHFRSDLGHLRWTDIFYLMLFNRLNHLFCKGNVMWYVFVTFHFPRVQVTWVRLRQFELLLYFW